MIRVFTWLKCLFNSVVVVSFSLVKVWQTLSWHIFPWETGLESRWRVKLIPVTGTFGTQHLSQSGTPSKFIAGRGGRQTSSNQCHTRISKVFIPCFESVPFHPIVLTFFLSYGNYHIPDTGHRLSVSIWENVPQPKEARGRCARRLSCYWC